MTDEAVCGNVGFDFALPALEGGARVRRAGWNGKGMWITLSPGGWVKAENLWAPNNRAYVEQLPDKEAQVLPYITMKTADGKIVPWTPSQTDVLSKDWEILK